MGKYLQDFMYHFQLPVGKERFTDEQQLSIKSASFIAIMFSFYLPKKLSVGGNIWRIVVSLSKDEKIGSKILELDTVLECKHYFNYDSLNNLNSFDRKKILIEQFCKAVELICIKYNSDFSVFESIKQKFIADKLIFDDYYMDKKASPDRQHFAQMKGFYTEEYENRALYVTILDKQHNVTATIFVGNYYFQAFDKLKWVDNKTIYVYHINNIQSYKSKKVAEDYFSINIETQIVTYNPVTRESVFDYGLKLLTETNLYDEAIHFIEKAKKMGHGKAENILKNLTINPNLKEKT